MTTVTTEPRTASPGTGAGRSGASPRGSGGDPPRVDLVLAPTPLHPAPRLSRELGVPVLFKRDDLAGVGLGGNKLRGLEFLIADALAQGCDSLVTGAGPQSNWTMLAALACLRYGLEAHVVCYGSAGYGTGEGEPQRNQPQRNQPQGNQPQRNTQGNNHRATCGCTAGLA